MTQERGRVRLAALIDDAESLVIDEGTSALSMRRLAERAGISLGNLQHYLPSRTALFEAMLNRFQQRLRAEIETRAAAQPSAALIDVVVDALIGNVSRERGFVAIWEMWSLARLDPEAAAAMDVAYVRMRDEFAALIAEASPGWSPELCARRATLVIGLIEGVGFLMAPGRPDHELPHGREDLRRLARSLVR